MDSVCDAETLEKSLASVHLVDGERSEDTVVENEKLVPRQDYVSQIKDLKEEIIRAWNAGDHVQSLKLSIKVARIDSLTSHFFELYDYFCMPCIEIYFIMYYFGLENFENDEMR